MAAFSNKVFLPFSLVPLKYNIQKAIIIFSRGEKAKTKHTIIMRVAVIAALAGVILPTSSSSAEANIASQKQDQVQDSPDQGTEASAVDTDNVQNNAGNDDETNDDHTSASEGPNGDCNGEQKDSTESRK